MQNEITKGAADDDFSIVLPLKKKDLGNFITSLLGQQQSLSKLTTSKFDIDHAWLVNLHELINQRICQQATAHLVDFAAAISFENDTKRVITTIEAFKGYIETKKETTTSVILIWNYLIHFPGKPYPEKQEIVFHARVTPLEVNGEEGKSFLSSFAGFTQEESGQSYIGYDISHTERTWGDDIENLVSNQIEKATRKENQLARFAYNCFRWALSIGIFIFLLLYPLYHTTSGSEEAIARLMLEYKNIENNSNAIPILSEKLNIIAHMIEAESTNKGTGVFSFLATFLAPFLFILTLRFTQKNRNSFIVISQNDSARRERLIKKESRSKTIMIFAYMFAIAAGVIGNYVYSALTKIQ